MRKKVTVVDIAAAAGVSVSTAGRVLNGVPGVSLQRRRKVLEAVRVLGASRLPVLPDDQRIKVLVIRMGLDDDPYFKRMDAALDQAAESLPSEIELVRLTNLAPFELNERIRKLDFRPHGAIVLAFDTVEVRTALERLGRLEIPIVTLTTDISLKTPRSFVGIDNEAAGRTAALMISRFVHSRGRVLMITGSAAGEESVLSDYDERLGAFYQREGMKAAGWSEQVVSRLRSVSNLHGREELLGELARMGFGLR